MQPTTSIAVPDTSELQSRHPVILTEGDLFLSIETDDDYATAAEYLKRNKAIQSSFKERLDPPIELAHKLHASLCKTRKDFLDPLILKETAVKKGMSAFLLEKDRRIKAEAERIRIEAEAEAERRRKEEEDRKRLEAERVAKEKEEIARREREEAAKRQAEADKAAAVMEAEGLTEAAQEVREQAAEETKQVEAKAEALKAEAQEIREAPIVVAPVPVVMSAQVQELKPKVKGTTAKKKYIAKVTRPELVPNQYREISLKKIQGVVDELGLEANIPGVEVEEDYNIGSRSA